MSQARTRRTSAVRRTAVGASALLVVGAAASGATAASTDQTPTVSVLAAAVQGSRQFFVEDPLGNPLTTLDLGSTGAGQPFQTRVVDSLFTADDNGFDVNAEMTNLYRKTGGTSATPTLDYATKIGSDKLSLGYTTVPLVSGLDLTALPTLLLNGTLPTCAQVLDLLGVTVGGATTLTGGLITDLTDAVPALDLTALTPLCDALGGLTATTGKPVTDAQVVLDEQVLTPLLSTLSTLPLALGAPDSGSFASPSYLGVGAGDPGKTATPATALSMLSGSGLPLDLSTLTDLLGQLGVPLDQVLGTGGLLDVQGLVTSLTASSDEATAALGTLIGSLPPSMAATLLDGILQDLTAVLDDVVQRLSGTYRSLPRLQADLSDAPAGDYVGTMTVTFVQD